MIRKILIANRGEIAIRIIRCAKEMGIETVAIYSTADKGALHVALASESVCVGGPRASDSYLNMNSILQAACLTGCDAIHPGFGFLSENSTFARLVRACGLIFIGPSPDLIDALGNKSSARETMIRAQVPVVPGSSEVVENICDARTQAQTIPYPLIIKASLGGGGKGMRIVHEDKDFDLLFEQAHSEAVANFGDGSMYLEKYIEHPKHVEVQLLADQHGNVVHLFERDCSFQRRNQKMMEEVPCFKLDEQTRENMFQDALKACRHLKYDSVGTIEFLLDQNGDYYFMEMNTRIQVEHPITEMVTGIDLIKYQIKVADGQELDIKQEDIHCRGVAMECRINAENPKTDFSPSPGKVEFINFPAGNGVRIESAVYCGYELPPYYDSMIMKVITYAPTRLDCIKKMRIALEELIVEGIDTNVEFQYLSLHQKKIVDGSYDTGFAETFIEELITNGEYV